MTDARPTQAVTPRRTFPLWGRSLGERSARLPRAVPADRDRRAVPANRDRRAVRWFPGRRRTVRRHPEVLLRIASQWQGVPSRLASRSRRQADRGDVPGWVLVTLMTAGLVLVLWSVARDRLTEVFNNAIDGVVGGSR